MSFSERTTDFLGKRSAVEAATAAARKRIGLILDSESFMEVGAFVKSRDTEFGAQEAAEGVVTGWGTVDGAPVCVFAQDSSAMGGAVSEMQAKKITALYEYALKVGIPVVGIFDSKGAKLAEGVDALDGYAKIIASAQAASGVVPTIAVISGICGGAAAIAASCFDFVISAGNGEIYMHSPTVLTANGISAKADAESVAANGIADFAAKDDAEAAGLVRALLSYLPANNAGDKNYSATSDDINRALDVNALASCDPKIVAATVADNSALFEVGAAFAPAVTTGFIRLDGETIGVVGANGELSADALSKASKFVSFCDAFGVSILNIVNASGFELSASFERNGISAAATLAGCYAGASSAMVTLITGKAIGSAYVTLCPKALGADMTFAWPTAEISALSADAAVAMFGSEELKASDDPIAKRAELTEKYAEILAAPYEAAKHGYIDEIIDPAETRQALVYAFGLFSTKNV